MKMSNIFFIFSNENVRSRYTYHILQNFWPSYGKVSLPGDSGNGK